MVVLRFRELDPMILKSLSVASLLWELRFQYNVAPGARFLLAPVNVSTSPSVNVLGVGSNFAVVLASGVVELSRMERDVSATRFFSDWSLKSEMRIFSVPSVVRSSLKRWEKEKDPDLETVPDPESSPLSRSLESMPDPVRVQKSVVSGSTFLVLTVVVSEPPSLMDEAEVLKLALDDCGSNMAANENSLPSP